MSAVCACLHVCAMCACVCAAFETHQVGCTEAHVGMWALWHVHWSEDSFAVLVVCFHIYVLPRGWALVTKFAWQVSLPAKPSWWFCCLSSLWSGDGGHTHRHARMHAHVHTPHVWGCSQGPKEELHDRELLDVSARNGTWVLCKNSRHSYWLSHNLPSPIILCFCSKSCLVYRVTPRALPGCSFAALSFLSPFLSLRPLTTWHRSIPVWGICLGSALTLSRDFCN